MKITIGDSSPDMGLFTQRTFCSGPDVLARANNRPVMTSLTAPDRGQEGDALGLSKWMKCEGMKFYMWRRDSAKHINVQSLTAAVGRKYSHKLG